MITVQYDFTEEIVTEIMEKSTELIKGDTYSASFVRNAVSLMFAKSRHFLMGKTGFFQHPDISVFEPEDYDAFIENPFDFIAETLIPRQNPGFSGNPIERSMTYLKYVLSVMDQNKIISGCTSKIAQKYGLFSYAPGTVGNQFVPFDYFSDRFRGFSKINFDIRRCPQKVVDATEALMPYAIWNALRTKPSVLGCNMIKTHMPTFLNKKDFEKFYWPQFLKLCHINAEHGIYMDIFCEDNWDRYIDYLQDLPQGTRLQVEYGTPQLFKDKLGKKMVLGGFYPLVLLKMGTKQECIDKAKEIIDVLAPGGNFYFKFDKSAYQLADVNLENYVAVMDYVNANSFYTNAGQPVTTTKREDTIQKYSHLYPEFTSKYFVDFAEFSETYPPADQRAVPYMKAQYDKYTKIAENFLLYI